MTPAGAIGIGLMITSLVFLISAAIEIGHGDVLATSANGGIAVFLLMAGGFLLWRAPWWAVRSVRLATSGAATVGVVTDMTKTWYQGTGEAIPRYALRFSYHDQNGIAHRGRTICAQTDAFQWRAGDRGLVHYDVQHPGRSVWIGERLQEHVARDVPVQPASGNRAPSSAGTEIAEPSLAHLAARLADMRSATFFVVLGVLLGWFGVLTPGSLSNPRSSVAVRIFSLVVSAKYLLSGVKGLANSVSQVRQWSTLLRDGEPVQAIVTAVREQEHYYWVQRFAQASWTIEYRYTDRGGHRRAGMSKATRSEAVELRPGDTVVIKYDRDAKYNRDAPNASVWLGKTASRPPREAN